MATSGKITMAVLAAKQDMMLEMLKKHVEIFEKHIEDDKKVEIKVDRLEQKAITRDRHFWAIYPALVVGYLLWFFGWK
jgi:hypothetical protein